MPEESPLVGKTVGELEAMADGEVEVTADHPRRSTPQFAPGSRLRTAAGDMLMLRGRARRARARRSARAGLKLAREDASAGERRRQRRDRRDGGRRRAGFAAGRQDRRRRISSTSALRVNLLAVSRSGERITQRMRAVRLGPATSSCCRAICTPLPGDAAANSRCLPLAARDMPLGGAAAACLPLVDPGGRDGASSAQLVPVAIAFFAAAVAACC